MKLQSRNSQLWLRQLYEKEVEAEQGTWVGSVENNRLADKRVAAIVKASFKNYERTKKKFEPAYFVKKEV